ncbi:hypothetical protein AVEN_136387-1 [Araneus ventricosus]|uniref:Uncharacterized protein n=1 Tax=Araneus ventricosus TaxID=182803 RepID=A0A4Y2U3K5_ARAVE|nr:hypothetical protein AVEN_136387-1 [Araneus ventricosus]
MTEGLRFRDPIPWKKKKKKIRLIGVASWQCLDPLTECGLRISRDPPMLENPPYRGGPRGSVSLHDRRVEISRPNSMGNCSYRGGLVAVSLAHDLRAEISRPNLAWKIRLIGVVLVAKVSRLHD